MEVLREILNKTYRDRVRNERMRETIEGISVINRIDAARL